MCQEFEELCRTIRSIHAPLRETLLSTNHSPHEKTPKKAIMKRSDRSKKYFRKQTTILRKAEFTTVSPVKKEKKILSDNLSVCVVSDNITFWK